jgi:hypothetical protein
MDDIYIDYQKIMKFFPPVNPNIENVLYEAENTYTSYNAISPLKPLINGELYSPQILDNLRTLRILLNSNISEERFIFELNKLIQAWGPGGYYNKNILNISLLELVDKINIKYQKQQDLIKEGQNVTLDYQIKQLEDSIADISIKNKSLKKLKSKDLDLSKLSINKSIKKRLKNKKINK